MTWLAKVFAAIGLRLFRRQDAMDARQDAMDKRQDAIFDQSQEINAGILEQLSNHRAWIAEADAKLNVVRRDLDDCREKHEECDRKHEECDRDRRALADRVAKLENQVEGK